MINSVKPRCLGPKLTDVAGHLAGAYSTPARTVAEQVLDWAGAEQAPARTVAEQVLDWVGAEQAPVRSSQTVGHAFEGARLTNTRQAAHTYLPFLTLHVTHTLAYTNQFPSSLLGKRIGPSDGLRAGVQSRLDPVCYNERTNEHIRDAVI